MQVSEPANEKDPNSISKLEWYISLEEEGHVIPQLRNAPILFKYLECYLNAFWELTGSRQIGFGLGEIPYWVVTEWLNENGIVNIEDRNDYRYFIKQLDGVYLRMYNKQGR